jgi:hypothetical protein
MVDSGAWGKLIHEKNLKSKISWHCFFKEKCVAGRFIPISKAVRRRRRGLSIQSTRGHEWSSV